MRVLNGQKNMEKSEPEIEI